MVNKLTINYLLQQGKLLCNFELHKSPENLQPHFFDTHFALQLHLKYPWYTYMDHYTPFD
jgi:hypothetical protein